MSEVLAERRGPALWVTFNRPEAHNAMTFAMYEALHDRCEEADADDEVRVLVLRGAGDKAFVAGTDIRQFTAFETPDDGVEYEATIDRIVGRLESVGKPTVALVDGYAMGSGLALSAACDLRICTPAARFGLPIARTVGNCLSMENYARLAELCETLAAHAPVTMRVTKEALRRLRTAALPDGDDLVREAYGSDGFRDSVAAFLARRG